MKITVFGATGRTGCHILAEGLRRGHQMSAFTRRPHALGDPATLAAVVQGDARDPRAVHKAIDGTDAVISTIAGAVRNDPHRLADVTEVITQTMAELGVRRLVVTSAYPIIAGQSSLGMTVLRRVLAAPYADGAHMARIVEASGLDWTIVYLNRLTSKPANGKVCTSSSLLAKPCGLTRADAAATLLDIVEDGTLAKSVINVAGL